MEMRTVPGFGVLLSGKRRDKEGKRGAREYDVLSPDLKIFILYFAQLFFTI